MRDVRNDHHVPRAADIGIKIGIMPSGPTGSIVDVPGVGVGHATVWRDEAPPPEGRGVARTGVTVVDPGGNLFRSPIPAGGAILNGAGECTGFIAAGEWGLAESPVFLTSTMQVGRVYDAACELLIGEDHGIGTEQVIIPIVAECDDSFLNDARRMQVSADDVAAALNAARASVGGSTPSEGAVGAGTGMSCLGFKGGIGTASRLTPSGHAVGVLLMSNFGARHRLTVDGVPVGRMLGPEDDEPKATAPPAGSCIVIVITDAPLDSAACARLARRAGLGLARTGSVAGHGSGEIFLAMATGLRGPRTDAPSQPRESSGEPLAAVTGWELDQFFGAVVDATEESVLNSMLAAPTVTGRDGNTSRGLSADRVQEILREVGRVPTMNREP
jgi:D-aminopeptidase